MTRVIEANAVAKFLLDTGLLYEINRLVLHKRGLELQVRWANPNGLKRSVVDAGLSGGVQVVPEIAGLQDCRETGDNGLWFSQDELLAGYKKLRRYDFQWDQENRAKRRRRANSGDDVQEMTTGAAVRGRTAAPRQSTERDRSQDRSKGKAVREPTMHERRVLELITERHDGWKTPGNGILSSDLRLNAKCRGALGSLVVIGFLQRNDVAERSRISFTKRGIDWMLQREKNE